ncbi:MAG: hypothetical protein ABIP71_03190 [Verrucomicrobiota bacterium]
MKVEMLHDMIHRAPFKPIELELDNGKKIPVKHPDFIFFPQSKKTVVITEGEHLYIVEVDHISNINSVLK